MLLTHHNNTVIKYNRKLTGAILHYEYIYFSYFRYILLIVIAEPNPNRIFALCKRNFNFDLTYLP